MVALHCGQRIHKPSGTPRFGMVVVAMMERFLYSSLAERFRTGLGPSWVLIRYHNRARNNRQGLFVDALRASARGSCLLVGRSAEKARQQATILSRLRRRWRRPLSDPRSDPAS